MGSELSNQNDQILVQFTQRCLSAVNIQAEYQKTCFLRRECFIIVSCFEKAELLNLGSPSVYKK